MALCRARRFKTTAKQRVAASAALTPQALPKNYRMP